MERGYRSGIAIWPELPDPVAEFRGRKCGFTRSEKGFGRSSDRRASPPLLLFTRYVNSLHGLFFRSDEEGNVVLPVCLFSCPLKIQED